MAISITEKILGNNKILTDNYLTNTIDLVKSITVVNHIEATLYNEYLSIKYPTVTVDLSNKSSWRYYKHLSSQYYDIDKDVILVSLDNGMTITLDKPTINLHRKSKQELLKFGLYYKELVDKYPEQELFIRSCITDTTHTTIDELIKLDNYTIVSHNLQLIEENEDNLIPKLQSRIDNYKNIWLIPYYHVSDNLFLTSQYSTFYMFLITSILAIRLQNAKTVNAHSYHIRNYLASHHYLDKYYAYLTKNQALYLYRNMLYLDNNSGKHETFITLINKLFTPRNITGVTYKYSQNNSTDSDNSIDYRFKQYLLSDKNLVHSKSDYTLNSLNNKVKDLTLGNPREVETKESEISNKLKNSLFNTLITKDIEFIVIDNTDTVRYKIIPTITDYWAYLLKQNKINFLLTLVDPVTNNQLVLNTKDAFKLFTIILYKSNNRVLTEFPAYTIKHTFHKELPETNNLLSACYNKKYWYIDTIESIKNAIPGYTTIMSSYAFEQYITSVYRLNIGLSLFLNNLSSKDDNCQFELMVDRLNTSEDYVFNDENVDTFLTRIGLTSIDSYDQTTLENFIYTILNNIFDSKLDFVNMYKYIQKALIGVFENFNSYTTQIVNNYYNNNVTLAGLRDTRYELSENLHSKLYYVNVYTLRSDMTYKILLKDNVDLSINGTSSYSYYSLNNVNIKSDLAIGFNYNNKVEIFLNNKIVNQLGNNQWVVNQSSEPDLLFLASNI